MLENHAIPLSECCWASLERTEFSLAVAVRMTLQDRAHLDACSHYEAAEDDFQIPWITLPTMVALSSLRDGCELIVSAYRVDSKGRILNGY